jgi:predicted TIM-barrel fold metal-dependent hydrolase
MRDSRITVDRILFVSADSHITPPPAAIAEYLEAAYQPWLCEYLDENEVWRRNLRFLVFPPEVLEVIDQEGAIRTGGDRGWDYDRRLLEMDREGVAAELLIASTHAAATPFFGYANRPYPPDVRLAGTRAYHRWLADFMAPSHGRMFGVALSGPCLDMAQTTGDLRWIADHGFRSVSVPGAVTDPNLPPLHDEYFEPYWATCEELGLVLSVHASHGRPQGHFMAFIERVTRELGKEATPQRLQNALGSGQFADSPFAPDINPQHVLWELIIGGVFDRYPNLTIAFTEVRSDWVPQTLRAFEARFDAGEFRTRRRPSDYWRDNCMAGASSIKRSEIRLRHEIGVDHLMFGRDHPHAEGTWPNTYDWIRDAFAEVPEDEARLILGENAVRCYGLDRDALVAVAERVGPRPEEILGEGHHVAPELVANFAARAGYATSREDIDVAALNERCVVPAG